MFFVWLLGPGGALGDTVLVVGDSMSSGAFFPDPAQPPWSDFVDPRYAVVNVAVGGTHASAWAGLGSTWYDLRDLDSVTPDLTVYMIGTAESQGSATPPEEFAEALELFGDARVEPVVLLRPPNFRPGFPTPASIPAFRAVMLEICSARADMLCGPDLGPVLTSTEDFVDFLHPSAQGAQKIAAEVDLFLPEPGGAAGPAAIVGLLALAMSFRGRTARCKDPTLPSLAWEAR